MNESMNERKKGAKTAVWPAGALRSEERAESREERGEREKKTNTKTKRCDNGVERIHTHIYQPLSFVYVCVYM